MSHSKHWKEHLLNYLASDLGLELDRSLSIPRVFNRAAAQFSDKPALLEKDESRYRPLSFDELRRSVQDFAAALIGRQFQPQAKVALFLKNSPTWAIADLGTLTAGGVSVPIYDTLSAAAIRHILNDSQSELLVLEDRSFYEKFAAVRAEVPGLKLLLVRKPWPGFEAEGLLSFEQFLREGFALQKKDPGVALSRLGQVKRDDLATIVYTSGTTAEPKGVMLSHRNLLSNVYGLLSVTHVDHRDVMLSILPLSHTFERTLGYYVPLLSGAAVAYCESPEKLSKNLYEARPTICCAVPRVFEKIYLKMSADLQSASVLERRIFQWALRTGAELQARRNAASQEDMESRLRLRHRPEDLEKADISWLRNPWLGLKHCLANLLVYRKIRGKLGGRLRYFVSGGAPLNVKITDFFHRLNVEIYEGYGLTETSPIISFNYCRTMKPGTVGKLLPSVQLKLSNQGEICVKGPNVMAGYYQNPQATAEVIDPEGWFHTGDVGEWDENHFLKITDRIKELIVLSTGKKVPPLPIENKLTTSPLVAQTVVLGNNQKYISALIFPNEHELKKLAVERGLTGMDFETLCRHPLVEEKFSDLIQTVNRDLSNYERIKRFTLLPIDLSREPELLTPTLKVKRRMVDKRFKEAIQVMYSKEELS